MRPMETTNCQAGGVSEAMRRNMTMGAVGGNRDAAMAHGELESFMMSTIMAKLSQVGAAASGMYICSSCSVSQVDGKARKERTVKQVAEQKVEREQDAFKPAEVDASIRPVEHGGCNGVIDNCDARLMSQMRICVSPTAPSANELAGQHVRRFDGGEHDFEDARGLFLNDGARHVQAVDHGRHGKQDRHDVAFPERGFRTGLYDGAVLLQLKGLDRDAFQQRLGFGRFHAGAFQPLVHEAVVQCTPEPCAGDEVAGGKRGISCRGHSYRLRFDGENAVDRFALQLARAGCDCAVGSGRDHIYADFAILFS